MTEVSLTSRRQPLEPADPTARPPLTLAEEHVLLLWQVTASADKLLTAAEHGRWPGTELTALAGYARAEVLRQASDEEALLFPAVPAQTAAGLARDHVRLRAAAELLTRAAGGEQPMAPAQLAAVVRDFVTQLERHLRNEDGLLASGRGARGVPATVTLGGHPHEWYLLTGGPWSTWTRFPRDRRSARPWTGCCGWAPASRSNCGPAPAWTRYGGRSANSARAATSSPPCRTGRPGGGRGSPVARQRSD